MLFNFPTPYPDELLYSVIARYHIRSGNKSFEQTKKEVFGNQEARAVHDLPTHIHAFVQNLPPQWDMTADDWIHQHTMYPYYAPFLPKERAERLFQTMLEYQEQQHNIIGHNGHFILRPGFLRFCPLCHEENEAKYGETYWKRTHQAPGVFVCPKHRIPLLDSTVHIQGKSREFIAADQKNCPDHFQERFPAKIHEVLVHLAEQIDTFLQQRLEPKPDTWFETAYLYLLSQQKLVKTDHRLNLYELTKKLKAFYGEDLLETLESNFAYIPNSNHYWLSAMLKKTMNCHHPVRHLLLIHFLGFTLKRFLDLDIPEVFNQPFGNGPWMCLNPVCEFYRKPVIHAVQIGKCQTTDRPLGVFECTCGFTYNRRGPDISESDHDQYTRVIAYGPVWENALKEKVHHQNLKQLSTMFGVSAETIDKKLAEFGMNRGKKQSYINRKKPVKVSDWKKKDSELLEKAMEAACRQFMFSDTRPVKLSLSTLGDLIGERHHLLNNLNRLPKTKEYTLVLKDNTISYQLKCLHWAVHYLTSHGHVLTRTAIRSLSKCADFSEEMKKEMEQLLDH